MTTVVSDKLIHVLHCETPGPEEEVAIELPFKHKIMRLKGVVSSSVQFSWSPFLAVNKSVVKFHKLSQDQLDLFWDFQVEHSLRTTIETYTAGKCMDKGQIAAMVAGDLESAGQKDHIY